MVCHAFWNIPQIRRKHVQQQGSLGAGQAQTTAPVFAAGAPLPGCGEFRKQGVVVAIGQEIQFEHDRPFMPQCLPQRGRQCIHQTAFDAIGGEHGFTTAPVLLP